jgi:GxxExxY protein
MIFLVTGVAGASAHGGVPAGAAMFRAETRRTRRTRKRLNPRNPQNARKRLRKRLLRGGGCMHVDDVTGEIVDAAAKVYLRLGPGLLESVCETVLARQLVRRGLDVRRQQTFAFEFDGERFEHGLRVDLLVNELVVVEVKSVEHLAPAHWKQVLTYLRLLDLRVGLLLNFGAGSLRDLTRRVVNNYHPSASPRLRVNRGKDGNHA